MRRFEDRSGRRWDVVVGRASWGTHCALFVPVTGDDVRQAVLRASAFDDAIIEIETMDQARLQGLLDASTPKEG
jgi:hypothetical protein